MTVQTDIVQALIASLSDDNHMVRSAAARALGRTKDSAATPALLEALRDKAGLVYDFALNALSEMRDPAAIPALMDMLHNPDADLRRAAVTVLGALHHREAVPEIINRLNDEVLAVGHAAAETLGKIGDVSAVPALSQILSSLHADWAMCINAAQALGALGDPQAVPAMIDIFRRRWDNIPGLNTTPPVRKNVIEALAKIGEPAVPYLLAALNDTDVKVRHGAVEALGHIAQNDERKSD